MGKNHNNKITDTIHNLMQLCDSPKEVLTAGLLVLSPTLLCLDEATPAEQDVYTTHAMVALLITQEHISPFNKMKEREAMVKFFRAVADKIETAPAIIASMEEEPTTT